MEQLFSEMDQDHNGTVDMHELKAGLEYYGCVLTQEELNRLMMIADENSDGVLTMDEFKVFLDEMFDSKNKEKGKGKGRRRKKGGKPPKQRKRSQLYGKAWNLQEQDRRPQLRTAPDFEWNANRHLRRRDWTARATPEAVVDVEALRPLG